MNRLKKNDKVIVLTGKDKGKIGSIIQINNHRIKVQGINKVKKSVKADPNKGIEGGIIEKEQFMDISNLMYYDDKTSKGQKISFKIENDKKVRFIKKTGEIIN